MNMDARNRLGPMVRETLPQLGHLQDKDGGMHKMPVINGIVAFRNGEVLGVHRATPWAQTQHAVLADGPGFGPVGQQNGTECGVYIYYTGAEWLREHQREYEAEEWTNKILSSITYEHMERSLFEIGCIGDLKHPNVYRIQVRMTARSNWKLGQDMLHFKYDIELGSDNSLTFVKFTGLPSYAIIKKVSFLIDAWNQVYNECCPKQIIGMRGLSRSSMIGTEFHGRIQRFARTANGVPIIHKGNVLGLDVPMQHNYEEVEVRWPTKDSPDEVHSAWIYSVDGPGPRVGLRSVTVTGAHLVYGSIIFSVDQLLIKDTQKLAKISYEQVSKQRAPAWLARQVLIGMIGV